MNEENVLGLKPHWAATVFQLALVWRGLNEIYSCLSQTLDSDVYSNVIHYNLNEEATLGVFTYQ